MSLEQISEVIEYFKQISEIPRGSGCEGRVNIWLKEFADKNNFDFIELPFEGCNAPNVLIRAKATDGFENSPCICLQAHTDMVQQKTPSSSHNFKTDPIKLIFDGDWIRADQTTLGADNGIGVAMAMAAATCEAHPELELLFTVDEEGGLGGASGLPTRVVKSKYLLNLDSEDAGFIIGCAGGERFDITKKISKMPPPENCNCFEIKISGLLGGHSGVDIHRKRVNAIKAAAELLDVINSTCGLLLAKFNGGSQTTAIARDVSFVFCIEKGKQHKISQICDDFRNKLLSFQTEEKDILIDYQSADLPPAVCSPEDTAAVITLINSLTCGVVNYCSDYKHIVETSSSLGTVELNADKQRFVLAGTERSCLQSGLAQISKTNQEAARFLGFTYTPSARYEPWQPSKRSLLKDRCIDVYKNLVCKPPLVEIVHAGLECAVLGKKYPSLDMISFGPLIENAHSPNERVSIESIKLNYKLLLEIIRAMSN